MKRAWRRVLRTWRNPFARLKRMDPTTPSYRGSQQGWDGCAIGLSEGTRKSWKSSSGFISWVLTRYYLYIWDRISYWDSETWVPSWTGLLSAIKRSTDYVQKSIEMGNFVRIPTIDTTSSEQMSLVPSLKTVETTTTKIFTFFQHLMVYDRNVRTTLKDDCLLHDIVTGNNREIVEPLRRQPDELTLSQQALIWAERGRSRSLANQVLQNKVPEVPLSNDVTDFNMPDVVINWIQKLIDFQYGARLVWFLSCSLLHLIYLDDCTQPF